MAARFHLGDIRVALAVIDELMVGQVLDAIVMGVAQDWEHAKPVRNQLVEPAIAKQHVMAGLVAEGREAMLAGSDEHDSNGSQRDTPHPAQVQGDPVMVKGQCQTNGQAQKQVFASQVIPIRDIIDPA